LIVLKILINIIEYNNINCNQQLNSNLLININYKKYSNINIIQIINELPIIDTINTIDKINNFVLIIDFPYYGGGTTIFLNNIISKYKVNQTFLIIRNINNRIHFYINDQYRLNTIFTDIQALEFLNKNKDKIIKIFINSIMGHSKLFLDNVIIINDDTTAITHDYSLIYSNPHLENGIDNTQYSSNLNINSIKTIITQNSNNLHIYYKYLENNKNIIITPLPDYINKLDKIITNNNKIIVGVLGIITHLKGKDLINELINSELYEVHIFGGIINNNNYNYNYQYGYTSIDNLNELLIKIKPNIWIEASTSAETYSYTLSLMMITDLPIIYLEKNFISVIKNRLATYTKAIPFNNIKELIDNKLIDIFKQDYFYTIEPVIYYNQYWNNYFSNTNYN